MNSNEEVQFAYRIRQTLNEGSDLIEPRVLARLHSARREAVNSAEAAVSVRFSLAGSSAWISEATIGLRALVMVLALSIGGIGTYYWNQFAEATENEEIDSALLADELPPAAYVDTGFKAWLDGASESSPRR